MGLKLVQDSLLEYQRAMVEKDRQNSFFAFWRCIEGLSLAGKGEKGDIVDRAMWALQVVDEEEQGPFINTVTNQLYDARNKWVHETNWGDIWGIHERVAKYLADAMIQLYVEEMYELEKDIISEIFRHIQMEEPQQDAKYEQASQRIQAIDRLRELEREYL